MPSFAWERASSRQTSMPSMKITFPDGTEDYAVLQRYNPIPQGRDELEEDIDQCIFDGYLLNEKDVYVTMAGCPNSDSFEVNNSVLQICESIFFMKDTYLISATSYLM